MLKRMFNIPALLAVLMIIYQLVVPIGSIRASANTGTMLPPSNLTYQSVTPDDGKLTWSAVAGASGYQIYQILDGQLTTLGKATGTTYDLKDLPEGSYRYVVSTLSSQGESGPSAPVSTDIIYPEMQSPTSFASAIKNGNDVVLSWKASQYTEKYNIYQVSENGEKSVVASTNNLTYSFTDMDEGAYSYTISSLHPLYGESEVSTPISVEVVKPVMKAPSNLSFTLSNVTDVTLKWQAAEFANSYSVYSVKNGQLELVQTVTGTTALIKNLPAGDYVYQVFSNSSRFGSSVEGSEVSFSVQAIEMTAPENVNVKILNTNDASLSWTATPNATGYKVYQVVEGERVLKTTVTGTSFLASTLPGGEYVYEVHSYSDRFGESKQGTQVTFTIESVKVNPPTNLNYKIQNGNDIVLSWTAADNATSYKVYQVIGDQKVLKNTVTGTTFTIPNVVAGDYKYEVHTNSTRFGESPEGTVVELTLVHPEMKAPANGSYTITGPASFTLNWNTVEYANSYKVYQVIDGKKIIKSTVYTNKASLNNITPGNYEYEVYSFSSRFGESKVGTTIKLTLSGQSLETPGNPSYTISNGNDIKLLWNAVQYANNYNIYQLINGEEVLLTTVTGTSKILTNVVEGEFQYIIKANSTLFGESPEGALLEGNLVHPDMAKPENASYSLSNGNDITLKWNAVQYANGYNIYRIVDEEKQFVGKVTGTSKTFTNMPEGNYVYEIHSYSDRFGESVETSQLSFELVFPIMQAPSNLTKAIASGNDIKLTWTASTYATDYKVYQVINKELVLQRTVTGTTTTFVNMPEGNYEYVVHSNSNRFGESPEGSKIPLDLVHPTMQAPASFTKTILNGNDIKLTWTASTLATEYRVYLLKDGELTIQKALTGTTTTFVNMPEGEYEYVIHSYSNRFGESPEGSQLAFPLVHPVMQAPVNLTKAIANGNDIKLSWAGSTYATNYKVYQKVDGELVLLDTLTGTSKTYTNMPEGDYEYVVHAYSTRFGESPKGSNISFNLTWPVVQAPVVSNRVENVNNFTLSWPAVTWANEYRVYKVTGSVKELVYKGSALNHKIYNLSEGGHSYEVTAVSARFGESVPSNLIEEKVVYPVMGVPTASLKLLSETSARISWEFVNYANGYNIYEVINGESVLVAEKINNLSYTINNLTYANHLYYVTSYSNSFGESKPSETVLAKLIIDEEAPVTTVKTPVEWVNEDQLVELTATDNEVGVAHTYYSLNDGPIVEGNSVLVTQEGINKIVYNSIDKVGNLEQVKTTFVKIDKTAPTTRVNDIPTAAQSFTLELNASDELSRVSKTYYSLNGSEYVEGTSIAVTKEGVNTISYYSVDAAGNKEAARMGEVNIDQTSPTTTVDLPTTWMKEDVKVTLVASDENSGVEVTYYSINGSEYVEGTSFVVESEGINVISYYSVDQAGNKEVAKTAEVKLDQTKPTTSTIVPEVWVNEDVTVNLLATDETSGVASTFYSINGTDYVEGTSLVVDQEGINTISYYSIDVAGNKENVKTVEVKLDKTAPITVSNVSDKWSKDSVVVTLAPEDKNSKVAATYYSINGSEYVVGTTYTVDREGINTISYYSVDAAGNVEDVKSEEVKIDKTAPALILGVKGEYELGETITLNYLAKDDLSGIAVEEVTFNGQTYKKGDQVTLKQPGEYKLSVKVTDAAGWSTVVQKTIVVYIPVALEVLPRVINGNKGIFTVKATLPKEFQSYSFNVSTVTLDGVSPVIDNNGLYKQAEKGHFKFERSDFTWTPGETQLELRGYIGKYLVVGKATATVKK
jgi:large repetitive protein